MKRDAIYTKKKNNYSNVVRDTLPTRLSKKWNTKKNAQQTNEVRLLAAQALANNHTISELALEIRKFSFKRDHFDENRKTKDNIYLAIQKRLREMKKMHEGGKFNDLLVLSGADKRRALKKRTVNPKARGRKQLKSDDAVEEKLKEWVYDLEENERRITRTMIFRKALELKPDFKGANMTRLKKWFYYGFVKRANLSICKIASVGQKLPHDWKEKMVNMRGRVRHRQEKEGVKDAYYFNTDHVPVWYESVGNYTWGRKDSGGRGVKTGGLDKKRFTVQFAVSKCGTKLIPFIIFQGKKA